MLSRLAQLCLRQAEAQTGAQLLPCLAAASNVAPSSIPWLPQQQYHHHQQQLLYSSSSDAALSPPQQQQRQTQQQHTQLPAAEQVGVGASSRSAAAQPTQPAFQILKVLIDAERPLTSHELYARVQQQYSGFPTRNRFKGYLKYLKRRQWAESKAPPVSRTGHKKSHKGSDGHWQFRPTQQGLKMDLNSPAQPLQALAQKEADQWTQKELPDYAEHMRKGRVPVTWQNLGAVAQPKLRQKLYQRHLLAGGGQLQLQGGDEAAAARSLQQQHKQKQRR